MATAYKYGFGPLGAAYTGYRYAKPYLGSLAYGAAAGYGLAKARNWYNRRRRVTQSAIGLAGYRPPEKKECVNQTVGAPVVKPSTTSTCMVNMVTIGQGSDKFQRIGNKVSLFSFQLNGSIKNSTAEAIKTRVMLVYDKEWNQFSNNPINFTVWLHALLDAPVSDANYVHTTRNSDYSSRFTVLKDWQFTLAPFAEPGSEREFKVYQRLKGKYSKFATVGNDSFSVSQGQIQLIYFTDRPATTTNPTFTYVSKIKYTDN